MYLEAERYDLCAGTNWSRTSSSQGIGVPGSHVFSTCSGVGSSFILGGGGGGGGQM